MKIVNVKIKDIKPYEKNAKKHPDDQVRHIANSLQRFGFRQPLVLDKDNVIVVGHGRLMAAKSLGMTEVPAVYADDLTEEEIKAYRLADNRTNESEWDLELMDIELDEIEDIDMSDFGFDMSDIGGGQITQCMKMTTRVILNLEQRSGMYISLADGSIARNAAKDTIFLDIVDLRRYNISAEVLIL